MGKQGCRGVIAVSVSGRNPYVKYHRNDAEAIGEGSRSIEHALGLEPHDVERGQSLRDFIAEALQEKLEQPQPRSMPSP